MKLKRARWLRAMRWVGWAASVAKLIAALLELRKEL